MERRFFLTGTAFSGAGVSFDKLEEKKTEARQEIIPPQETPEGKAFASAVLNIIRWKIY